MTDFLGTPYMTRVRNLRRGLGRSGRLPGSSHLPLPPLPITGGILRTPLRFDLEALAAETQAIIRENREARARLAFAAISQME